MSMLESIFNQMFERMANLTEATQSSNRYGPRPHMENKNPKSRATTEGKSYEKPQRDRP